MSTVEIAELTGKEHKHVLRDAEVMLTQLQKDRSIFGSIFFDGYGRPQPCLNLPKLECLTLVSGYSVDLRYRIVGRWLELEAQASASWFRRSLATGKKGAVALGLEDHCDRQSASRRSGLGTKRPAFDAISARIIRARTKGSDSTYSMPWAAISLGA